MAEPAISDRAAERLVMDYAVETTPRTTKKVVKGPKGRTPPPQDKPKPS